MITLANVFAAQSLTAFIDWALAQGRIWLTAGIGLVIVVTLIGLIVTKSSRGALLMAILTLLFVAWVALNWRAIVDAGHEDFNDHSNALAVTRATVEPA